MSPAVQRRPAESLVPAFWRDPRDEDRLRLKRDKQRSYDRRRRQSTFTLDDTRLRYNAEITGKLLELQQPCLFSSRRFQIASRTSDLLSNKDWLRFAAPDFSSYKEVSSSNDQTPAAEPFSHQITHSDELSNTQSTAHKNAHGKASVKNSPQRNSPQRNSRNSPQQQFMHQDHTPQQYSHQHQQQQQQDRSQGHSHQHPDPIEQAQRYERLISGASFRLERSGPDPVDERVLAKAGHQRMLMDEIDFMPTIPHKYMRVTPPCMDQFYHTHAHVPDRLEELLDIGTTCYEEPAFSSDGLISPTDFTADLTSHRHPCLPQVSPHSPHLLTPQSDAAERQGFQPLGKQTDPKYIQHLNAQFEDLNNRMHSQLNQYPSRTSEDEATHSQIRQRIQNVEDQILYISSLKREIA